MTTVVEKVGRNEGRMRGGDSDASLFRAAYSSNSRKTSIDLHALVKG